MPDWNRVRYEMLARLGYFVTESSEHFAEYVPWFIKRDRPDLIEKFNVPLDEYIQRCELQIAGWQFVKTLIENPAAADVAVLRRMLEAASLAPVMIDAIIRQATEFDTVQRSHEFGSGIIHSMETGIPQVIYGNVSNHGLIDNLPQGCCVEVPCVVDRNGIQPTRIGALPPQLAALMQTNINVQALTVELRLPVMREYIYHARDALSAHRRRAGPGSDLASGQRSDRRARRLVTGISLTPHVALARVGRERVSGDVWAEDASEIAMAPHLCPSNDRCDA